MGASYKIMSSHFSRSQTVAKAKFAFVSVELGDGATAAEIEGGVEVEVVGAEVLCSTGITADFVLLIPTLVSVDSSLPLLLLAAAGALGALDVGVSAEGVFIGTDTGCTVLLGVAAPSKNGEEDEAPLNIPFQNGVEVDGFAAFGAISAFRLLGSFFSGGIASLFGGVGVATGDSSLAF
jgi:hypothetical protein